MNKREIINKLVEVHKQPPLEAIKTLNWAIVECEKIGASRMTGTFLSMSIHMINAKRWDEAVGFIDMCIEDLSIWSGKEVAHV